jgi:quercetin dioxygenase-like cupin family protein
MNGFIGTTRRCAVLAGASVMLLALAGHVPVLAGEDAPSSQVSGIINQPLSTDLEAWSVKVVNVVYPPGGASQPHRHPAEIFAYVESGAVVAQIEDGEEITYTAGQLYYEPPMVLHRVSRNASATEPAKVVAFVLIEDGKPVVIPEE